MLDGKKLRETLLIIALFFSAILLLNVFIPRVVTVKARASELERNIEESMNYKTFLALDKKYEITIESIKQEVDSEGVLIYLEDGLTRESYIISHDEITEEEMNEEIQTYEKKIEKIKEEEDEAVKNNKAKQLRRILSLLGFVTIVAILIFITKHRRSL